MLNFIINSTPTSQIYTFVEVPAHIVGNCPYKFNQVSIELIFGTTQPTISVSFHIPMT